MATKTLTVVIDEDGNECLYIDGSCAAAKQVAECEAIYATDLAAAANDQLCILNHLTLGGIIGEGGIMDEWPDELEDLDEVGLIPTVTSYDDRQRWRNL